MARARAGLLFRIWGNSGIRGTSYYFPCLLRGRLLSACPLFAAMDVPPRRQQVGQGLFHPHLRLRPGAPGLRRTGLPSPIKGEGVASKPYGADGSIAEENGGCKCILILLLSLWRQGKHGTRQRIRGETRSTPLRCAQGDRARTRRRLRLCRGKGPGVVFDYAGARGPASSSTMPGQGARRRLRLCRGKGPGVVFRLRPLGYAVTSRTMPGQGARRRPGWGFRLRSGVPELRRDEMPGQEARLRLPSSPVRLRRDKSDYAVAGGPARRVGRSLEGEERARPRAARAPVGPCGPRGARLTWPAFSRGQSIRCRRYPGACPGRDRVPSGRG